MEPQIDDDQKGNLLLPQTSNSAFLGQFFYSITCYKVL